MTKNDIKNQVTSSLIGLALQWLWYKILEKMRKK